MRGRLSNLIAIFGALALVAALAGSATAANRPLVAVLAGANEVPGPGDANGRGVALIRRVAVANGTDKICWFIVANKIALPATGAHIHSGAAGASGGIVLALGNPTKKSRVMGQGVGMAHGCTDPAAATYTDALLDQIWASPSGFYVNVHTSEFTGGAIRGQLR
jgi:hypothetical protein